MVEFMGGSGCPNLMLCVDNGIPIKTYTFVDISSDVHVVARAVVAKQHARHPHLLRASAIQGFDKRLAQDIRKISAMDLVNLTTKRCRNIRIAMPYAC